MLLLAVLWAGAASAQTFDDVSSDHLAYNLIEILSVNRAQMSVFLERDMNGSVSTYGTNLGLV